MKVQCPHCEKQLKLGEKIQESLKKLEPGRRIKLKCVHCAVPFGLDRSILPDERIAAPSGKASGGSKPPAPPDLGWLKSGAYDDREVVDDIPRALVLMPDIPEKKLVAEALEGFNYQVDQATIPEEAIANIRFINYAAVFLHTGFEPGGIRSGGVHRFMCDMSMARRRDVFYVLIGEQFETLYDLQALVHSANLVVNNAEVPHISTILKKSIPEYEALFGPLMEELQVAGK